MLSIFFINSSFIYFNKIEIVNDVLIKIEKQKNMWEL